MLGPRAWLAMTLLLAAACAQQPLIQGDTLNQQRLEDIVERASRASGLSVMTPLEVEVVTRNELRELLEQEREQQALEERQHAPPEVRDDAPASAEAAVGLGALSESGEPPESTLDIWSRVTEGLYLPRTHILYLINEPARGRDGEIHLSSLGNLDDEITLAHEVIHALQHQHFPHLFEPAASLPQNQADADAALRAAIEGSATFTAISTLGYLGVPRDPDEVIADSLVGGPLDAADPVVREHMSFPYTYGYRLAYHEGMEILASPPASTEQVIHLDVVPRRRPFLAIDLSGLREDAEALGCSYSAEDTLGELGISLWLRTALATTDASVAEGWDGDRFIAVTCAGEEQIAWLTSWDTPEDAAEFEQAVTAIALELQQHDEPVPPLDIARDGREVAVKSLGFPIGRARIRERASRARVTTREELAAHFRAAE